MAIILCLSWTIIGLFRCRARKESKSANHKNDHCPLGSLVIWLLVIAIWDFGALARRFDSRTVPGTALWPLQYRLGSGLRGWAAPQSFREPLRSISPPGSP